MHTPFIRKPCRKFDLAPLDAPHERGAVHADIQRARFERAQEVLTAMEDRGEPRRAALTAIWALVEARIPCLANPECGPVLEEWTRRWVPRARELTAGADPPLADSLRHYSAALLALDDHALAMEIADEIGDPELWHRAHGRIAELLVGQDARAALEAIRRSGDDWRGEAAAVLLVPIFRSLGSEDEAREALGRVGPGERGRLFLDEAERLRRLGPWSQAREWALGALEDWRPGEDPLTGPRWRFAVFAALNIHQELIDWALALDDPADRAVALVRIIGDSSAFP